MGWQIVVKITNMGSFSVNKNEYDRAHFPLIRSVNPIYLRFIISEVVV